MINIDETRVDQITRKILGEYYDKNRIIINIKIFVGSVKFLSLQIGDVKSENLLISSKLNYAQIKMIAQNLRDNLIITNGSAVYTFYKDKITEYSPAQLQRQIKSHNRTQ